MTNAPTPAGMAGAALGRLSALLTATHLTGDVPIPGLGAVSWNDLRRLAALAPVAAEGGEKDKLRIAVEALRAARKALYHHYVEWDGEPEDAVPLQTAMADCDEALSALRTEPTDSFEGFNVSMASRRTEPTGETGGAL